MAEKIRGVNKGPTGGSYQNECNHIAQSGETFPTEATDVTGAFMSYMPVQDAGSKGVQRQASEKEVRGGNA